MTENSVSEMLRACGVRKPERIVRKISDIIAQAKRDEKIYAYRGSHTEKETAEVFGKSESHIRRIVKDVNDSRS